jgi:YD repeat-containing protein
VVRHRFCRSLCDCADLNFVRKPLGSCFLTVWGTGYRTDIYIYWRGRVAEEGSPNCLTAKNLHYDALGRVTSEAFYDGEEQLSLRETVYDDDTNTTQVTDENGNIMEYRYQLLGEIGSVIDVTGGSQLLYDYYYDNHRRLMSSGVHDENVLGCNMSTAMKFSAPD